MFNQISRGYFPIFIDDYESCADYDFLNEYSGYSQLIISKVEKGTDLKIADAKSNKFTTFSSDIINTQNVNIDAENVKKAA